MAQPAWFEEVFGFQEMNFKWTQKRFKVEEDEGRDVLVSVPSGKRFVIGPFECLSVASLRARLAASVKSTGLQGLTFKNIVGDAGQLHGEATSAGAVFQVASQFNCLEMMGPERRPEDGVAIYAHDLTQGPACALACPAATIFRNYLVNGTGQAAGKQLDLLSGVAKLVENGRYGYWQMKNGYCLPLDGDSMERLSSKLAEEPKLLKAVRDELCVGVHWSTSVAKGEHEVCQVFCSGLPLAYAAHVPEEDWVHFATAVLDGAYDATLAAAAILARKRGKRVAVYLTALGGGAFGNRVSWIAAALEKALKAYRSEPLDVFLVHFRAISGGESFTDIETHLNAKVVAKTSKVLKRPAAKEISSVAKKRPAGVVRKHK